ncbi:helix-turn-helix domain-containing protein [Streptomyces niveus]|uniref:GbsR/MarR family transcriptional regulator n=1 Tax=Streptomyces niveus TaxID=193462 RepID=UPI0038649BAC|nr:helix-turn-helix domain-containing protein [Streptomyces niveus]
MPGGRLSHDERRDIGAGLAKGLGYAEIARRLGRPTSTVSREVARNGGADGYRADRALRATERRARRRGPAPLAARPQEAVDRDELHDFGEQFVAMLVATGLPRMASRVLVRLFLTDSGSLTAADLVGQLRVSPASVSKAVGYLEELDVVRRERDPRRRRERYVVDDDVWLRAWTRDTRSTANWADTARRGVAVVGADTPAGVRLDRMGDFFATLSADMASGPAGVEDALTLLAALMHAGARADAGRLAAGLGWPAERVTEALRHAEPQRLTPAQRAALTR